MYYEIKEVFFLGTYEERKSSSFEIISQKHRDFEKIESIYAENESSLFFRKNIPFSIERKEDEKTFWGFYFRKEVIGISVYAKVFISSRDKANPSGVIDVISEDGVLLTSTPSSSVNQAKENFSEEFLTNFLLEKFYNPNCQVLKVKFLDFQSFKKEKLTELRTLNSKLCELQRKPKTEKTKHLVIELENDIGKISRLIAKSVHIQSGKNSRKDYDF